MPIGARVPPPDAAAADALPKLPKLRPVEVLVRDRELHGYGTLREVMEVLLAAAATPGHHRVVLHGPDTLYITRQPAAVEWLQECGFTVAERSPCLVLHLASVPDAGSPEWEQRRQVLLQAAATTRWAMECNSALLTLAVRDLALRMQLSAPCRLELSVRWVDELGNARRQELGPPSGEYVAPPPGSPLPAGEVARTHPLPDFPQPLAFATECDAPCVIEVRVLRRRLVADKLKAIGSYEYSNAVNEQVDVALRDPEHPHGLPIGSVVLEIASLAHKFFALEQAQRMRLSPPVRLRRTLSGDGSIPLPSSLALAREAPAPLAQDECCAKGGGSGGAVGATSPPPPRIVLQRHEDGTLYDTDDYF